MHSDRILYSSPFSMSSPLLKFHNGLSSFLPDVDCDLVKCYYFCGHNFYSPYLRQSVSRYRQDERAYDNSCSPMVFISSVFIAFGALFCIRKWRLVLNVVDQRLLILMVHSVLNECVYWIVVLVIVFLSFRNI